MERFYNVLSILQIFSDRKLIFFVALNRMEKQSIMSRKLWNPTEVLQEVSSNKTIATF